MHRDKQYDKPNHLWFMVGENPCCINRPLCNLVGVGKTKKLSDDIDQRLNDQRDAIMRDIFN